MVPENELLERNRYSRFVSTRISDGKIGPTQINCPDLIRKGAMAPKMNSGKNLRRSACYTGSALGEWRN